MKSFLGTFSFLGALCQEGLPTHHLSVRGGPGTQLMTKGMGLEAVNLLKENFQSRAILAEKCGLSGVSPLLAWETGDIWP